MSKAKFMRYRRWHAAYRVAFERLVRPPYNLGLKVVKFFAMHTPIKEAEEDGTEIQR